MENSNEKIATVRPGPAPDVEVVSSKAIIGGHDIGKALYQEVQQYSAEELEVQSKEVLRLIDWYIMPMVCVTYTIQFLDKLSLNYASAYTLKADLDLTGQRYSWVAAIFNFGYLFWALAANILIQRLPVGKYTGVMIFCWAIILICHIATENYAGMLVLRFILAFNGMATTMVDAILGYGLWHATNTALASWKLIFLVIGLPNLVWSVVFLWICPDSPTSARFLDHKQKLVAVHRIAKNMTGVKTPDFVPKQAWEAVTDLKVIGLALIGFVCGVINGGVSNFSTLLQFPTVAFELFLVPVCGLVATYVNDARCIMCLIICLPPFGGLLGIRLTNLDHQWTLVGCTWLQFLVGGPVILTWNLLTTNIAGHKKCSFSNRLWFIFYAGNIAGANIFFAREAPRYFSALAGLLACYGSIIVLGVFLYVYMAWENRRRDKIYGKATTAEVQAEGIAEGFLNQTDKKSVYFRYSL